MKYLITGLLMLLGFIANAQEHRTLDGKILPEDRFNRPYGSVDLWKDYGNGQHIVFNQNNIEATPTYIKVTGNDKDDTCEFSYARLSQFGVRDGGKFLELMRSNQVILYCYKAGAPNAPLEAKKGELLSIEIKVSPKNITINDLLLNVVPTLQITGVGARMRKDPGSEFFMISDRNMLGRTSYSLSDYTLPAYSVDVLKVVDELNKGLKQLQCNRVAREECKIKMNALIPIN